MANVCPAVFISLFCSTDNRPEDRRAPIFSLPSGFQQRLGRIAADFFYSGVFQADGLKIGFIRVPSYTPPSSTVALQQFEDEMVFSSAKPTA